MLVDTKGLGQEQVGKRLRVALTSGEVDEIKLLDVTACDPPQPCCGIMYTVLSTNQPAGSKTQGGTYWTAFGEIDNFRVLGD
jgi:hypothetical protein